MTAGHREGRTPFRGAARAAFMGICVAACLALSACSSDPASGPVRADGGTSVVQAGADAHLQCGAGGVPLARTLSSGATWQLCFSVDPHRGMVLSDVGFAPPGAEPVAIASSIALAQLEVPYDTGKRLTSDITDIGFGGIKMQSLTGTECPGELVTTGIPTIGDGTEFGEVQQRPVLCSDVDDAGLAYRAEESGRVIAARHDSWQLFTIATVGWYQYVSSYTLDSDGSITPSLGATGDLSPVDYTSDPSQGWPVGKGASGEGVEAASHSHNAVWRIQWALGNGPLQVQQYDATPTGRFGRQSPIVRGRLATLAHPTTAHRVPRRWWRVVNPDVRNADGHPISYEIVLGATDSFTLTQDEHLHGPHAGYDVAFTNADDCQVYATNNDGPCGADVPDYITQQRSEALSSVVSWVAVGFHHVPRDEDQSPMQMHWQSFVVRPRDLTAQRVDVGPGRDGLDGQPKTWDGERVDRLEDRVR